LSDSGDVGPAEHRGADEELAGAGMTVGGGTNRCRPVRPHDHVNGAARQHLANASSIKRDLVQRNYATPPDGIGLTESPKNRYHPS